jgi:outer membrane protein assembly factor BamB
LNSPRVVAVPVVTALLSCVSGLASSESWRQLQHDATRTGYTAQTVKPPYRARWIWFGPDWTLRNQRSKKGDAKWADDLVAGSGKAYHMPKSVSFCFAGSMQPIIHEQSVYVGDSRGKVYAIGLEDGTTRWTADNRAGTLWPGVASSDVVAFPSVLGYVTGYAVKDGRRLWQLDTGKAITSALALEGDVTYAASQNGHVYAIKLSDGTLLWKSPYLGAPIQGGLSVAFGKVYTGTEAMEAVSLDATDGRVLARHKLLGQSFRMLWPVVVKNRVIFTVVPVICPGSEYVNDGVLAGAPGRQIGWVPNAKSGYANATQEDEAKRKWLSGAGRPWQSTFALRADTLAQDYIVAMGATEGCGTPPDPPAIDGHGRPLVWWATAFPTLTKPGTFGSSYAMDLSPFDLETGTRVPIDNKRFSGQTTESDNLYGLAVGGDIVFLRQNFRGTWAINLNTSNGSFISAIYRTCDGGTWPAAITYAPDERGPVKAPRTPSVPSGRVGPAIVEGRLVFAESFAVTCVETDR